MLDMKWVCDQMNNDRLKLVARTDKAGEVVSQKRTLRRQRQFITAIALGLIAGVTLTKAART